MYSSNARQWVRRGSAILIPSDRDSLFTVVVQHATTGGKEPKQWLSCRDCLWLQQYCPC
jgi:hypothetical protein